MFKRLNHYLQKFSYTRLGDDEVELRPLNLRINEISAYSIVEDYLRKNIDVTNVKFDKIHHEIFVPSDEVEITYLFTNDEDGHALVSVTAYSEFKGVTYKKIIEVLKELKQLFSAYIIETK